MKMHEARARRDEILRRIETESGPEIAASLGISRQRVQQIVSSRKSARSTYNPERTRLARKAVHYCHSCLTGSPRTVFVRVTDIGWSICLTPHADATPVGAFTSSISFDEFMDEAEFVALEMARNLYSKRVAA